MSADVGIVEHIFEAAAALLRDVDPSTLPDGGLLAGFEELLALEAQLRAVQTRWLALVDARDATVGECGRVTRSWLVEELRLSPADASRRVLLARALPQLAAVEGALAAGDISAEHALAIVKGVRGMGPDDAAVVATALTETAAEGTPGDVAAVVDAVRERVGLHESREAAYARRYAERNVGLDVTFGGFGSLSGTLSPEVAETLRVALEAAAPPAGPEDERSLPQRRHDGLGEIAAFYLANADALPPEAGERPRVVVTIDWQWLVDSLEGTWPALDSGVALSPAAARRLACDADLLPAVLGSGGELLDLGRTTRVHSTAIRRAAAIAQQHRCGFPRCRRPIRELHHVVWWSRGGPTSADNAAWLCAFHHWLAHEGGWTLSRGDDGGLLWTAPTAIEHRDRHTEAA